MKLATEPSLQSEFTYLKSGEIAIKALITLKQ